MLDTYYDEDGTADRRLQGFSENIDGKAAEILGDYEEAAEERKSEQELDYDPHTILVNFDADVEDDTIEDIINNISDGGVIISGMYGVNESLPDYKKERIAKARKNRTSKTVAVDVGKNQTTDESIKAYEALDMVQDASKNSIVKCAAEGEELDEHIKNQWYLDRINVKDAWKSIGYSGDCNEIWVAVIDTGVDLGHQDMVGRYLERYCVDVTGDKPVRLSEMEKPYLDNHGTMVSGIICANADNGIGIDGVTGITYEDSGYGCKVMAIKAAHQHPWEVNEGRVTLYTGDVVKGVEYAVENGAEIINMSINSIFDKDKYTNCINYARQAGVMVVAAAGNYYEDLDTYPSDLGGVTSVIAVDENNDKTAISNYGSRKDISAPGYNIYTCDVDSKYCKDEGTSLAAPMVAATAAMIKSIDYDMTPEEIDEILKKTATDIGEEGKDNYTGYGLLNTGLAVQLAIYRSYKNVQPVIKNISSQAEGSISFSWNSIGNEKQMLIYRSESKYGTYTRVGKMDEGTKKVISYTDGNLVSGKTYYYKICCRSAYGNGYKQGEYSEVVSFRAS